MDKRPYIPPRLTVHDPKDLPERIQFRVQLLRDGLIPISSCSTVVDQHRKFIYVSDEFCKLVGYKAKELIGSTYDRLTVPNTADIPTTYHLFVKLGYMQGLWLLLHRTGHSILIRYEAWLRADNHIQSSIELVQTI